MDRRTSWWRFNPMWATVAAGVLLVAFTVWWPRSLAPPAPLPTVAVRNTETESGLLLFDQVDTLADDALPPTLQTLAAAPYLDDVDDDLDWLVPDAGDTQNDDSWI